NLALAPRERVLLVRLRMQEHRELAPHRQVTGALQLLRLCPDHHPVALADRHSQQPVPYRAADQVDSHGAHVNRELRARRGESRRCCTCCVRRARVAAGGGLCAAVRLWHLVSHAGCERRVAGTAPACAHRYAAGRPAHAAALRTHLEEVHAAREFASGELGLPDSSSYRSYADIGRPYVVWNVVAAPEFSVSPKRWCFPIAGCVAYRGYFRERRAREFAAALAVRGYDVSVDGVPAYSTLGRFADPVLSSMLRYGDDELAATIFHELAHQLLYVRDDSQFNEAFASTVEDEGLER